MNKMMSLLLLLLLGRGAWVGAATGGFLHEAQRHGVIRLLLNDHQDLPTQIREALLNGNFSGVDPLDLVSKMPAVLWNTAGAGPFLTMGATNLTRLASLGRYSIPQRVLDQFKVYRVANASTTAEVVAAILENYNQTKPSQTSLQLLFSKLGTSAGWTAENITALKDVLFFLPPQALMRTSDPGVLQAINRQVQLCITSGDDYQKESQSCPSRAEMRGNQSTPATVTLNHLRLWLSDRLYGSAVNWTITEFSRMDLYNMPPTLLPQILPHVIITRRSEIVSLLGSNQRKADQVGRAVVQQLLAGERVMEKTYASEVVRVVNRLGSLRKFVRTSDLPSVALRNYALRDELIRNAAGDARSNRGLDQRSAEQFIREFVAGGDLTETAVTQRGMTLLALAMPDFLSRLLSTVKINHQQMRELLDAVLKLGGPTTTTKLRQLSRQMLDMARVYDVVDVSKIHPDMMDMIPHKHLNTMTKTQALDIFMTNPRLRSDQKALLLAKIPDGDKVQLPASARTAVSIKVVDGMGAGAMSKMVAGLDPSCPLALLAAQKAFGSRTTLTRNDIVYNLKVVPFMGAAEARKLDNDTILETLAAFKDAQPSLEACVVLKDKYVATAQRLMGAGSEAAAFQMLTAADVEALPPCVVAAFGRRLVREMDDVQKVVLMQRLVALGRSIYQTTSIPRATAALIMEEGFRVQNIDFQLTGADVAAFQEALLLLPPDALAAADEAALPDILQLLNRFAGSSTFPCLDGRQRSAIRKTIVRYKGSNITKWESVRDVCCLLGTLTSAQLDIIPDGALTTCRCDVSRDQDVFQHYLYIKEVRCRVDLGEDFAADERSKLLAQRKVEKAAERLLGRNPNAEALAEEWGTSADTTRRSGDVSPCQRAAISGADTVNALELSALPSTELMSAGCLSGFGGKRMSSLKARVLVDKLRDIHNGSLAGLSPDTINAAGFILTGLRDDEIQTLPDLSYTLFSDAVVSLGQPRGWTQSQLSRLAKKVVWSWKPLAELTGSDILKLNNILCGLTPDDVAKLPSNAFREAGSALGLGLALGSSQQCSALPALALKAEEAHGSPEVWTKQTVAELGPIVAGLAPQKLQLLAPAAMAGITPLTVSTLTPQVAKVLTAAQLSQLTAVAALSLTAAQKNVFNEGMLQAIKNVPGSGGGGGSTAGGVLMVPLLLAALVAHGLLAGVTHLPWFMPTIPHLIL